MPDPQVQYHSCFYQALLAPGFSSPAHHPSLTSPHPTHSEIAVSLLKVQIDMQTKLCPVSEAKLCYKGLYPAHEHISRTFSSSLTLYLPYPALHSFLVASSQSFVSTFTAGQFVNTFFRNVYRYSHPGPRGRHPGLLTDRCLPRRCSRWCF